MKVFKIKKGLDLPIDGALQQFSGFENASVKTVALMGTDTVGVKPTMLVKEGDSVRLGQVLFTDKKNPGVKFTSPGCGKITAIHRGEKRALLSVVISLSGSDSETFQKYGDSSLSTLSDQEVVKNLVDSGLWTAFRTRPYSKIPAPEARPRSIFVTAMDSNPLALDPAHVLTEESEAFKSGLKVLSRLPKGGKVYVCQRPDLKGGWGDVAGVETIGFQGPHPSGLAGTHIHFLDPVGGGVQKTVWSLHYQDVISIGKLFTTGKLHLDRWITISGPAVQKPRAVHTRVGASTEDLTRDLLKGNDVRVISGSVFSGLRADGPTAFLGRYHLQVSALKEGRHRDFLGWQMPGLNKFSVKNIYAGKFLPGKKFDFTTNKNGSDRSMVPVGSYEGVMPLDILPTHLLRSLIVQDTEQAQKLGCLELDEEDLALCTFVCPGKYEYGPILRSNLSRIEKEG